MIIDYQEKGSAAGSFEIIDLATNDPLTIHPPYGDVFYADDEAGVIRFYLRDADGNFFMASESEPTVPLADDRPWEERDRDDNLLNPVCVAWREERRAIRIVPKAEVGR